MKKTCLLLLLIPLLSQGQDPPLFYWPIVETRNDTAYCRGFDIPYTGQAEVYYDFEHFNGRYLKMRGYYQDGFKHGRFISYYQDKSIEYQEYYRHGKKEGEMVYKFRNGYLKLKEKYKNGILDGQPSITAWYISGQLKELGYYTMGKEDTAIYFDKEEYDILIGLLPFEKDSIFQKHVLQSMDTVNIQLTALTEVMHPNKTFSHYDSLLLDSPEVISVIIASADTSLTSKVSYINEGTKSFLLNSGIDWFYLNVWLRSKENIYWNLPRRKVYLR